MRNFHLVNHIGIYEMHSFGLHDRPWYERPIFGRMRYMSQEGMRRKTNAGAYT